MSAKFLLFVLFFVILALQIDADYVGACREVCGRISRERDACCRAHGYTGMSSCAYCY